MTPDMRVIDRIAQVLASTGALGTFATRRTASANELRLDVVGVGPIPLPLSPANARRLCGIAHPARYGLRDQTLLDRNVRDAWQIGKRQVKIDARRWRRTLDPELEQPREFTLVLHDEDELRHHAPPHHGPPSP